MNESIVESILRQCYASGCSHYDTGIGGGIASICIVTCSLILDQDNEGGSKQPDLSI